MSLKRGSREVCGAKKENGGRFGVDFCDVRFLL